MQRIFPLHNPVQPYAWGSHTAIADLLGRPSPTGGPEAELWMGAHPKAPSMADTGQGQTSLIDLIAVAPKALLGESCVARFGERLSFLFKVLAAGRPLSIQAHPDPAQAKEGFERENRLGVPIDAPDRNYRDDSHKPEILCALTPFWALCGFRSPAAILDRLCAMDAAPLEAAVKALADLPASKGLKAFFESLMGLSKEDRQQVSTAALAWADRENAPPDESEWVRRLADEYPGDPGILAPVFLNLIRLQPGTALFLPARTLHAYLEGTGIELMANSDNVLRGGLTPKHVDVPELLSVLDFREYPVRVLSPEATGPCESVFSTPAEEFALSEIRLRPGRAHVESAQASPRIFLCVEGSAAVRTAGEGEERSLSKGASFFAPANSGAFSMTGDARIYKARTPDFGGVAAA